MNLINSVRRLCSIALILAISCYGISMPAMADIVPTSELLATERMDNTRAQLGDLLARDEVASMLAGMGVDVDDARDRVGSLSESELQTLSQQLDTLPAGQSALGTVALVLLILILLDVAGITDIFPGV